MNITCKFIHWLWNHLVRNHLDGFIAQKLRNITRWFYTTVDWLWNHWPRQSPVHCWNASLRHPVYASKHHHHDVDTFLFSVLLSWLLCVTKILSLCFKFINCASTDNWIRQIIPDINRKKCFRKLYWNVSLRSLYLSTLVLTIVLNERWGEYRGIIYASSIISF